MNDVLVILIQEAQKKGVLFALFQVNHPTALIIVLFFWLEKNNCEPAEQTYTVISFLM